MAIDIILSDPELFPGEFIEGVDEARGEHCGCTPPERVVPTSHEQHGRTPSGGKVWERPAGSEGDRPRMLTIPVELILEFCDFLPLYDAVKFSLTCSSLYSAISPHLLPRILCRRAVDGSPCCPHIGSENDQQRWHFLKSLESTLPNHVLCSFCRIFHPRVPRFDSLWRDGEVSQDEVKDCVRKDFTFEKLGVNWGHGFMDAYAAMNRHLYKAPHGIPASDLCVSTEWAFARCYKRLLNAPRSQFPQFLSYVKLDTEAKIVRGQLLVHRVQRLWVPIHPQGTEVLMQYGIDDLAEDFKVCAHHQTDDPETVHKFVEPLQDGLRMAVAAAELADEATPFSKRLISYCENCPTEDEMTFIVHDDNSIEIIIDVWQNLGQCRELGGPGWLNCWSNANRNPDTGSEALLKLRWINSSVGYVPDEDVLDTFSIFPGSSAVLHPSAAAVRDHWSRLQRDDGDSKIFPGVPSLSVDEYKDLKKKVEDARTAGSPTGAPFRTQSRAPFPNGPAVAPA